MKKLLTLAVLSLAIVAPSFGSEHLATRSAKFVGHKSCQAAKDVSHASLKVVKFVV